MAKQEITLQGLDGQLDELILTTNDETANGKLEDCARMLFPQEGETTPRLRFKGFEGEWQKKLLSDCLEISDEKNTDNIFGIEDVLSVSDENGVVNQIEHLGRSYAGKSVSGYKILRPGQIVYTKSPLRAKPYGIVKHNTGKAGIVSVLYAVYNPKEGVAPEYIHYYFDPAWRLNAYMRPLVYKGAKNTMNISDETALTGYIMIPKDIEEQKRIASFLQRLDDQMKLHQHQFERLKQLKSACLDSMFPQQSENTPPIRFKGFEGEWMVDKLSSYASRITRKNTNMETSLPLTISAAEGLIAQTAFFNNVVASTNMSGYYLLKKGEFAYNKSYSNGYPFGAVKKLEKYEQGALSPLYIVFSLAKSMDDDYIVYFFETDLWHKEVAKRAAEGARNHGLLNIGAEDFLDINITFPSDKKEQKQIASFFKKIDSQITAQQERLERLKQMKNACLDGMFPQNGGYFSSIRFKGYNGDWAIEKLSILAKPYFISNKNIHHQNLLSLSYGKIVKKDIQTKKGLLPASFDTYQMVKDGIIVFRFTDLQNDHKSLRVGLAKEEGIISPAYVCVQCENVLPEFLYLQLHTFDLRKVFYTMGDGMRQTLSYSDIKDMDVFVPSMEEQHRIVTFFQSFDKQISLQTLQLEKLEQMKKACLKKMIA